MLAVTPSRSLAQEKKHSFAAPALRICRTARFATRCFFDEGRRCAEPVFLFVFLAVQEQVKPRD
jgi:hypothetical protein